MPDDPLSLIGDGPRNQEASRSSMKVEKVLNIRQSSARLLPLSKEEKAFSETVISMELGKVVNPSQRSHVCHSPEVA